MVHLEAIEAKVLWSLGQRQSHQRATIFGDHRPDHPRRFFSQQLLDLGTARTKEQLDEVG